MYDRKIINVFLHQKIYILNNKTALNPYRRSVQLWSVHINAIKTVFHFLVQSCIWMNSSLYIILNKRKRIKYKECPIKVEKKNDKLGTLKIFYGLIKNILHTFIIDYLYGFYLHVVLGFKKTFIFFSNLKSYRYKELPNKY